MTTYRVDEAAAILERTPRLLREWLRGLPEAWVRATEGEETWCAHDIVGHLIHGERTDWIPRAELILRAPSGVEPAFTPFDREGMREEKERTLEELLKTFETERAANIAQLRAYGLKESDLDRRGRHPEFGPVTLRQHLACWVAHDLTHVAQIARVMAKRYKADVGPWTAYLSILK